MINQNLETLGLVCEPEPDKHLLVGIGFNDEGVATDLTAITFKIGPGGAIFERLYITDLEEHRKAGIVKLISFAYEHYPEQIWWYDKAAYDAFYEMTLQEMVNTGWGKGNFFYFDQYAEKHRLNMKLVDTSEASKAFVTNMFYVMQKRLKA